MSISKEQYDELKVYVVDRLKQESNFFLNFYDFQREFGITKPFYKELIRMVKEDKMPFHTDGGKSFDLNGDPSLGVYFDKADNTYQ